MKKSVLIIDDDKVTLQVLEAVLRPSNVNIFKAVTADEGLEVLTKEKIDLVIVDHGLPDKNGIQVLKEIKQDYPRLPVILLTASEDKAVFKDAWNNGAFEFIKKMPTPVLFRELAGMALKFGHLNFRRRPFWEKEEQGNPTELEIVNSQHIRNLLALSGREKVNELISSYKDKFIQEIDVLSLSKDPDEQMEILFILKGASASIGLTSLKIELGKLYNQVNDSKSCLPGNDVQRLRGLALSTYKILDLILLKNDMDRSAKV